MSRLPKAVERDAMPILSPLVGTFRLVCGLRKPQIPYLRFHLLSGPKTQRTELIAITVPHFLSENCIWDCNGCPPRVVRGQSIRHRPPDIGTQTSFFGGEPRA